MIPRMIPSRRTARFVAVGVAAYGGALLWTIPAALVVPRGIAAGGTGGTLWRGNAVLADGSVLGWRWAPLRSLVGLGFAADWTLDGPGSALAGRALLHSRSVVIDEASGSAAGSLLALALPELPFACATPLRLALDRVAIGGADQALRGEIRSAAGSCAPRTGGDATPVPPLVATFGRLGRESEIMLAPAAARRELLVHGTLARDGRLVLQVTRAGAAALPFASPPRGMTVDTAL